MFSNTIDQAKKLFYRARIFPKHVRSEWRGYATWRNSDCWNADAPVTATLPNPLREFFEARKQGRGIWKWSHYFEAYDHHFRRFRGTEVHILEIGIYSGGSLEMWRDYFGPHCSVYGVDIEPACKAYEDNSTRVFIGDQSDRNFWELFKKDVPHLDIVIDDGGHLPEQQIVTLEELLPHLRPGGVYVCEDVHGGFNDFASYVHGLAQNLNACDSLISNSNDSERRQVCKARPIQSFVGSIHLYPYMTVVERTISPVSEIIASKRGTEWEPFLK